MILRAANKQEKFFCNFIIDIKFLGYFTLVTRSVLELFLLLVGVYMFQIAFGLATYTQIYDE